MLADFLADGQPVNSRQHDVEHDQVGLDLAESAQRLGAIPHSLHLVALAGQVQARELDDVILVIDHQDF